MRGLRTLMSERDWSSVGGSATTRPAGRATRKAAASNAGRMEVSLRPTIIGRFARGRPGYGLTGVLIMSGKPCSVVSFRADVEYSLAEKMAVSGFPARSVNTWKSVGGN